MAQEKMRWLEKEGDGCRENKRKGRSIEKGYGCQEKEMAVEKRRWLQIK